ncbi:MAG: tRNA 2-thiouridine(34) synthase MnmA [Nitrospiria bacterium]
MNPPPGDIPGRRAPCRVVVGMSGGVDSAVTAALLKEAGHEVIGVTLTLWEDENEDEKPWQDRSCCKIGLARHVAKQLSIPHHALNIQELFQKEVIDDFCDTYLIGQTPNPCVRCNERVKFAQLLSAARTFGADYLATGHYSRIEYKPEKNRYALLKGTDLNKDQSYFLYRLSQGQLAATLFPLGGMTKAAVYQKASEMDLPYEEILESQEVCFVTQKDYRSFLKAQRPEAVVPGEMLSTTGEVVGQHEGLAFYTVGQRRGLKVALGERSYVTRLEAEDNRVVIGSKDDLLQETCTAVDLVWGGDGPPVEPITVEARVRHRAKTERATLSIREDRPSREHVAIRFHQPVEGITPGQAIVFYQGDEVVGGGTIQCPVKKKASGPVHAR